MHELSPQRQGFSDSSRLVPYYRPSPDGTRMIFGGRALNLADRPENYAADLHRLMTRIFPQLRTTAISHAWSGTVAYTFDFLGLTGLSSTVFADSVGTSFLSKLFFDQVLMER